MKTVLIGDVHGKTHIYQKMLRQRFAGIPTIQLGDMGLGFAGVGLHKLPAHHKFFRGNHDDPEKCKANPNYLGDFGYLPDSEIFYLAGASSIDRDMRVEGVSWWRDEELSMEELGKAFDLYSAMQPRFVVSHECPTIASIRLLTDLVGPYFAAKGGCQSSRTCQALQNMYEVHQPEVWVFGHYHVTKRFQIGRTVFQCLSELEAVELDSEKGLCSLCEQK